MRWFFHEKTPASCLMQGRKIFFTRYHPDLRIFSMRLHWACIGAIRHGLNVLAHACSRAMFFRAAPPLSTIRGSLWTRPSEYSPLPGIYRLSYDFPKEMSRGNCGNGERLRGERNCGGTILCSQRMAPPHPFQESYRGMYCSFLSSILPLIPSKFFISYSTPLLQHSQFQCLLPCNTSLNHY